MSRTVIFVDTMGGFEAHVAAANGNHIEVDGSTTINPLHIERAPDSILTKLDTDPYSMSADSARNLLDGIMQNQGADPKDYLHTLDELVHLTYRDADIYPNDPASHDNESPTMADMLRVAEAVLETPTEYTVSDSESESSALKEEMTIILRRLNGFTPTGTYRNLVGQTEVQLETGAVNYLDLRKLEGKGTADKSVQLSLMLRNVYEAIKRADGKTLFVIDEAHYLLQSPQMITWLEQASRHLRHYNGALWFVSQSPADFADTGGADEKTEIEQKKDIIRGQCSTIDFFQLNELTADVAEKFGMGPQQREFVTNEAVAGEADLGHTTAMTSFSDKPGWFHYEVKRGPIVTAINNYEKSDHGDFNEYMADVLSGGGV